MYFQAASTALIGPLEGNEQRTDHRRNFDGDPQQANVVDQRCHRHSPGEDVHASEQPAAVNRIGVVVGKNVPDGENGGQCVQESRRQQEHKRKRVDPQPAVKGRDGVLAINDRSTAYGGAGPTKRATSGDGRYQRQRQAKRSRATGHRRDAGETGAGPPRNYCGH